MPDEKSARRRGVLLVLVATILWSLAGLFARLLVHLDVWTVMGWRALLGAASIATVGLIEWRNGRLDNPLGFGALSPLVALLAMIAISAYTASVMTTTIADVMGRWASLSMASASRPAPSWPPVWRLSASSSWWRAGWVRGVSWGRPCRC